MGILNENTLALQSRLRSVNIVCPLLVLVLVGIVGCGPSPNREEALSADADVLDIGIEAHGGLATWQQFSSLEYEFVRGDNSERHIIDLQSRKVRVDAADYSIGFDGDSVWVLPGLEAYSGNPLFYSSLNFYFFAMPFVLADPGTHREELGSVMLRGSEYDAVRISFDPGVGASSDDYYVAHFSSDDHQMEVLLYTVTFTSGEKNERYNARVYEEWQDVEGLKLPRVIAAYQWDNEADSLGARRGESSFNNVRFAKSSPAASIFAKPSGAETYVPSKD